MITFLTYTVVILGIIALVRLASVYQKSRELRGLRDEDISAKDNKLNAFLFLVFMIGLYGGYIYLINEYSDSLLPKAASAHGYQEDSMLTIDGLMHANLIVVNIIFVIINTLLFLFAFKYVREKREKADYFPHNNKLEVFWTVIPSIFLAFIIIFGLTIWNDVMDTDKEYLNATGEVEEPVLIELYARQFDWHARYAGNDGALGTANVRLIGGTNQIGIDEEDPMSKDDKIVRGEFHIPVGRPVKFKIRSQDVIHSAYMPHFRAQINAVPGMETFFAFTPTITTAEMRTDPQVIRKFEKINRIRLEKGEDPVEFDYVLLCNKICGASHYNMQMKIVVDTPEDYQKWLSEKKTFAESTGSAQSSNNDKTELAEKSK